MKSKSFVFFLIFLFILLEPKLSADTPRAISASSIYNTLGSTSSPGYFYIPTTTPLANRACYFDSNSTIQSSSVTSTELGYLSGATSNIQAQINAITSGTLTGLSVTSPLQSTGGTSPTLSIIKATSLADGYLSSTDWSNFNGAYTSVQAASSTSGTGNLVLRDANGNLLLANGSAPTPALAFASDTSTGIYGTTAYGGTNDAVVITAGGHDLLVVNFNTNAGQPYVYFGARDLALDGDAVNPAYGFFNNLGLGAYRSASDEISIAAGSNQIIYMNPNVVGLNVPNEFKEVSTPANPAAGYVRLYAKSDGGIYYLNSSGIEATIIGSVHPLVSPTAPTISSGFGTGASIANNNGTAAFTVNVGVGGTATNGVIGLPTATNGWNCFCNDITTQSASVFLCKQISDSTTSATIENFNTSAVATAWVASDIVKVSCFAY